MLQWFESLKEVTKLFEDAQISVFKLMASVKYPSTLAHTSILTQRSGFCAQVYEECQIRANTQKL